MFGVFDHTVNDTKAPIIRGYDEEFQAPHSRHTEVRREDIERIKDLDIISESEEAGRSHDEAEHPAGFHSRAFGHGRTGQSGFRHRSPPRRWYKARRPPMAGWGFPGPSRRPIRLRCFTGRHAGGFPDSRFQVARDGFLAARRPGSPVLRRRLPRPSLPLGDDSPPGCSALRA